MSIPEPSAETLLPETFGTAFILNCSSCGQIEFSSREQDRFERMQEFHRTFCDGTVETHELPAPGPTP